ncbi:hypothetical protein C7M84_016306 [Penaeus vannamei]|uniref:Transmembrane protein n=1 Tax=Penaeus vannamei TaxID=6689 RepID=A0A423SN98_PENVA|nr:hypothetical protein C7M84_016306 [Penaeus vannamei]
MILRRIFSVFVSSLLLSLFSFQPFVMTSLALPRPRSTFSFPRSLSAFLDLFRPSSPFRYLFRPFFYLFRPFSTFFPFTLGFPRPLSAFFYLFYSLLTCPRPFFPSSTSFSFLARLRPLSPFLDLFRPPSPAFDLLPSSPSSILPSSPSSIFSFSVFVLILLPLPFSFSFSPNLSRPHSPFLVLFLPSSPVFVLSPFSTSFASLACLRPSPFLSVFDLSPFLAVFVLISLPLVFVLFLPSSSFSSPFSFLFSLPRPSSSSFSLSRRLSSSAAFDLLLPLPSSLLLPLRLRSSLPRPSSSSFSLPLPSSFSFPSSTSFALPSPFLVLFLPFLAVFILFSPFLDLLPSFSLPRPLSPSRPSSSSFLPFPRPFRPSRPLSPSFSLPDLFRPSSPVFRLLLPSSSSFSLPRPSSSSFSLPRPLSPFPRLLPRPPPPSRSTSTSSPSRSTSTPAVSGAWAETRRLRPFHEAKFETSDDDVKWSGRIKMAGRRADAAVGVGGVGGRAHSHPRPHSRRHKVDVVADPGPQWAGGGAGACEECLSRRGPPGGYWRVFERPLQQVAAALDRLDQPLAPPALRAHLLGTRTLLRHLASALHLPVMDAVKGEDPEQPETQAAVLAAPGKTKGRLACPEWFMGSRVGYPRYTRGFAPLNCSAVPFRQVLTAVLWDLDQKDLMALQVEFSRLYPGLPLTLVTEGAAQSQPNVVLERPKPTVAAALSRALSRVTTPYVLLAPRLAQLSQSRRRPAGLHEGLRGLPARVPAVPLAGGAAGDEGGGAGEPRLAPRDLADADADAGALPGHPGGARPAHKHAAALCPDAMFLLRSLEPPWEVTPQPRHHDREMRRLAALWQPLVKRRRLARLHLPSGLTINYPCHFLPAARPAHATHLSPTPVDKAVSAAWACESKEVSTMLTALLRACDNLQVKCHLLDPVLSGMLGGQSLQEEATKVLSLGVEDPQAIPQMPQNANISQFPASFEDGVLRVEGRWWAVTMAPTTSSQDAHWTRMEVLEGVWAWAALPSSEKWAAEGRREGAPDVQIFDSSRADELALFMSPRCAQGRARARPCAGGPTAGAPECCLPGALAEGRSRHGMVSD